MEIDSAVARFLDSDGRITQMPRKRVPRQALLTYLAQKFETGVSYTERQVNDICDQWHTFGDYFLLRRELVDSGLLGRERNGSRYWRTELIAAPTDPPSERDGE